jgi:hypothetical protein
MPSIRRARRRAVHPAAADQTQNEPWAHDPTERAGGRLEFGAFIAELAARLSAGCGGCHPPPITVEYVAEREVWLIANGRMASVAATDADVGFALTSAGGDSWGQGCTAMTREGAVCVSSHIVEFFGLT